MKKRLRVGCSWSGGKDSCYGLMQAVLNGAVPKIMVTMMNENGKISRSHGLPWPLLQQQATVVGLPIIAIPTTWIDYERNFVATLRKIRSTYDLEAMVFGDIDVQTHRDWEEMVCTEAGIEAITPIWQRSRRELILEMLSEEIEAIIVSCNDVLGKSFLGKILNEDLISELEDKGVDVCGENGEFHTIVVNCPIFTRRLKLPPHTSVSHKGYNFLQWKV